MAPPLLVSLCLFWCSVPTFAVNGPVKVELGQDAVLPCSLSTKENIETKLFDWKKDAQEVFRYNGGDYSGNGLSGQDKQFEGRVSHFSDDLKNGVASIKIRDTKLADSGVYTCEFPRLSQDPINIELVVDEPLPVWIIVLAVLGSLLVVVAAVVAVAYYTKCHYKLIPNS